MAKATVTITAKDEMSKGLMQAKKSAMQFQQTIDKVGSALSKAFKIGSVTAAIMALGKSMTDCVKEFTEAEKVSMRLSAVWENVGASTGKTAREMDDLAEALEKETYFTSEAIKEAGLLLASTESLTEDGFDRALEASLDLATAMGTDVTSAAQTLAKALVAPDEAFKSLKSVGVAFTEAEQDQIRTLIDSNEMLEAQDLILGRLEQKYRGVAQAVADTPSAKMDQIKDTLGDIKEDLGQGLVYALSPAFDWILKMLQKIERWANQLGEKAKYNDALNQGRSGDVTALAKNFTEDTLNEKLADANKRLDKSLEPLKGNYYLNVYLERSSRTLADFLDDTLAEQMSFLMKVSNNDAVFASMVQQELVAYNTTFEEVSAITKALQKQIDDAVNSADDFKGAGAGSSSGGSSASGGSGGADDTVLEPTELEKVLSKYGKMSTKWQMLELQKQIDSILNVYGDASLEEQSYLNQILGTLFEQKAILEGNGGGGTSEGSSNGPEKVVDEKTQAFQDSVFSSLFSNLGEVGSAMSSLSRNIVQMGPVLGTLMTGLEYVMQGFGEALAPFVDLLTGTILKPLVEIGKAIGTLILPVLQLLTPVLNLFANIVLTITGTFQYIGQLLQHWVATVLNWLASLDILGWRPFAGLETYDPGSPGSLKGYLSDYKNSIMGSTGAADSEATHQAVSSASYRGATSVTINIYQEAPVVGDNGMRQFAQMIRDEFEALDYYGVTA